MKISKLLATHHTIIQQAQLANLAQAYATLRRFAERVRRARLCGLINLRQPNIDEGRFWASLTALEGNQSVIEEHFSDEETMEFADAIAFTRNSSDLDITFRIEALSAEFVAPLESELREAGVVLDLGAKSSGNPASGFPWLRQANQHRGGTPNPP
jgi:hypothetical protein